MARKFIIYCLVLNFCLPAIYSSILLFSSELNTISSLFVKLIKESSLEEELEDKKGEKESKPFEKDSDKEFLSSYYSLDFSLLAFQKVSIDNSITLKRSKAFFEITTPPPKFS